jgi:hypothetical protein
MVFVCGPIAQAVDAPGMDEGSRRFLEVVHETLEKGGLRVWSAHRELRWGQIEPSPAYVAKQDLALMRACDATVIVLGTPSQARWRTEGTFIELGWAIAMQRPLVVVGDLDAYPSTLVRGLPSLSSGIRILTPNEVQADRTALLRFLKEALAESSPKPLEP